MLVDLSIFSNPRPYFDPLPTLLIFVDSNVEKLLGKVFGKDKLLYFASVVQALSKPGCTNHHVLLLQPFSRLRILTGRNHRQMKLQCLEKV